MLDMTVMSPWWAVEPPVMCMAEEEAGNSLIGNFIGLTLFVIQFYQTNLVGNWSGVCIHQGDILHIGCPVMWGSTSKMTCCTLVAPWHGVESMAPTEATQVMFWVTQWCDVKLEATAEATEVMFWRLLTLWHGVEPTVTADATDVMFWVALWYGEELAAITGVTKKATRALVAIYEGGYYCQPSWMEGWLVLKFIRLLWWTLSWERQSLP